MKYLATTSLPPPSRFSRRGLFAGAGLTVAGVVLAGCGTPSSGSSGSTSATRSAQVLVVGAGLSGLCAARELTNRGVSCVVLEARKRIGGRMVRQSVIEDGWIDLGGQWVGPSQTALLDLAKSLAVNRPGYPGDSIPWK